MPMRENERLRRKKEGANLPNRDSSPISYRGPYDPPRPAGYDPGRARDDRQDHNDEQINRAWRLAMEEEENEKEEAKAREDG